MQLDFFNYKKLNIDESLIQLKKYRTINKKIDLIKIDTNGFELPIIKGLIQTIRRDRSAIIVESNQDIKKIDKILKKFSYKSY